MTGARSSPDERTAAGADEVVLSGVERDGTAVRSGAAEGAGTGDGAVAAGAGAERAGALFAGAGGGGASRVTVPGRLKFSSAGLPMALEGVGLGEGVAWLVAGAVCCAAAGAASTMASAVIPPAMVARRPMARPASFP